MDEKTKLRNQLFEKYFENQEGIFLESLVQQVDFIVQIWQKLHHFLKNNLEDYKFFGRVSDFRKVTYQDKDYLVMKVIGWTYCVIDMKERKVIHDLEKDFLLNEEFFVSNRFVFLEEFKEVKNLFYLLDYQGEIEDLIAFYFENEQIFQMTKRIYYRITIGDAWTSISVNLRNGSAQLVFETPDQFLYEQLFFSADLKPSGMQDATSKIGKEKMLEMFSRSRDIKIPYSVIPEEILEHIDSFSLVRKKSL